MADLFDNPMGLMGFEFVEFASPDPEHARAAVRDAWASPRWRPHRSKDVHAVSPGRDQLHRQQRAAQRGLVLRRRARPVGLRHGVSRASDSHKAYARALELGAQPIDIPTGPMELRLPAIKGIGGAPLYLIDRFEDGKSIYDIDFEFIDGVDRHPVGARPEDHRPPDAQRLPRPHGLLGRLLREAVQLPRDPLLRHQGRVHRPDLQGHDRARRHDPHPAERGVVQGRRARSKSS